MTSKFSRSEKEGMKEHIDKMDSNEHLQILDIIKKYTDHYTKTESGVLISADNLSDDCLQEINMYIHFSLDQRKRIEDDNKTRKTYERLVGGGNTVL
jgi:hypothetical protein